MSNQPAILGPDGVTRPYIGGQALLEGVMMRSPHAFSAVVRRKSGELVVREHPMQDPRKGKLAWPLVRGVVALAEALKLGSRALRFSAELYESDLEAEGKGKAHKPHTPGLSALWVGTALPIVALLTQTAGDPTPSPKEEARKWMTVLSTTFAVLLFVALPQASAAGVSSLLGLELDVRSVSFQLITAAAKLTILVGYMLVLRRIPELYRVFQYHGAEHKAIYTYESGQALTVGNAKPKTTLHPRCGTTFIVMVALVSILIFSALGPLLPKTNLGRLGENIAFFLIKLPFLPLVAAITFELQRILARFGQTGPARFLLWPGFLVQKITTVEPDDTQLEVALSALLVTLKREQTPATGPGDSVPDATYPAFAALELATAPIKI